MMDLRRNRSCVGFGWPFGQSCARCFVVYEGENLFVPQLLSVRKNGRDSCKLVVEAKRPKAWAACD